MLAAVVGAGLGGLTAAVTLREHGHDVLVYERAAAPGGTSAWASGWIWRYRDLATFAWGAPHGDRALQRSIWDGLPDALRWLDGLGVTVLARQTGNPRTEGVQVEPRNAIERLTDLLPTGALHTGATIRAARWDGGDIVVRGARGGAPFEQRVDLLVCAGGGYAGDLERVAGAAGLPASAAEQWTRRNAGGSDGSGIDVGRALGADVARRAGESYTRLMAAGVPLHTPRDHVRFAQVYATHGSLLDGEGRTLAQPAHDWAETAVAWELARTGGGGWLVVPREALGARTPYGTVADALAQAEAAGAVVEPRGTARAIGVRAGVTHTYDGLRVDARARVLARAREKSHDRMREDTATDDTIPPAPSRLDRVRVAGVDAGGVATGGYASGLAQALVLGRLAGH